MNGTLLSSSKPKRRQFRWVQTLVTAIFILFTCSGFSAEKKARLHYQQNVPVYLDSVLTLNMNQSLPALSLSSRARQHAEAILMVTSDQPDLSLLFPPFDLIFILQSLKIDLHANDAHMQFDSDQMESSLYLSPLSKIMNRPIRIHFDKNFVMEKENEDVNQMLQELPSLRELNPETLLAELFSHLFSLAGEELTVGQTFHFDLGNDRISGIPQRIDYTVTSIDDYTIQAAISGDIEKTAFQLEGLLSSESQKQKFVDVSVSGTLNGTIKWNRDNAMLYELDMHYDTSGTFKLGEWEWIMQARAHVHNRTTLKPQETTPIKPELDV